MSNGRSVCYCTGDSEVWVPTEWEGISKRQQRYKVVLPGGEYKGTFGCLKESKDKVMEKLGELKRDRSKRDPDYQEKLGMYLDFVKTFGYEPGDKVCHAEYRSSVPHMLHVYITSPLSLMRNLSMTRFTTVTTNARLMKGLRRCN